MLSFENYIIRPLTKKDLLPYFDLVERNRSRLEDFFTGTTSKTKGLNATEIFIDEMIARRKAKSYFPYLLVDTDTKEIVAFFDLKNVDWKIPKTEIGCYTDYNFSGKGITSKAMQLFVDYCFNAYNFRKIYLRTHHSNKAAQIVAKRAGFELEGTIRMDYITTSGELVDLMYFGKINTDFK